MKHWLGGILVVLVILYILYAFNHYHKENKENECRDVNISINNTASKQFIDAPKIKESLINSSLNPIGKKLKEINTWDIEQLILKNEHTKTVQVFFTNVNVLEIKIDEKKPILRIEPNNGNGYYLDEEGNTIKLSDRYSAYLPVATGNISDSVILKELYIFAKFLDEDPFWNAQVDQIIVDQNKDLQIISHVGGQMINLGNVDGLETKLKRLMIFYKEGLNKVGWNKYSKINLKFDNQVVCSE